MRTLTFIAILFGCSAIAAAGNPGQDLLEQEAGALAQEFIGQLKPRLKEAMKEGGPTHAIEICAGVAPKIADSLSAQSGWLVKRVSLKSRNASRAVPDEWERAVLQQFDRRQRRAKQPAVCTMAKPPGTSTATCRHRAWKGSAWYAMARTWRNRYATPCSSTTQTTGPPGTPWARCAGPSA